MKSDYYSCSRCVGKKYKFIKFGKTKNGKQRFQCNLCKKTSVLQYSYFAYRKNIDSKIIQFTKEGLGIRSTARILKISPTTLLKRIVAISKTIKVPLLKDGSQYEVDELKTFIQNKSQATWLIYALDKVSKTVAYFSLGRRTNENLNDVIKVLSRSNPQKIYTDKLKNYQYLIPKEIHSTKRFGTNSIERKNLSIRTHLKRLNRRTICFSKCSLILSSILKIYFWT